jgi:tetratricopeptide (TPR) repeat protein
MLGLLDKARKLRDTLGLPSEGREEFVFDPDSGITRDEQKEIRREIEKVASSSRMAVSPEMFVVKAAKRGVLFPVAVNVGAVLVLVAGLAVLYFLFQRGETQAARQDTSTITAEGKLLAQVKKESEARLQEKNSQINQIEGRLAEIDQQRQDLQSTMDAKVQAREAQLKAAMAAELDTERTRLQKQGLSEQDIQKRLSDLEAQKNIAFNAQLSDFRALAEADKKKSEAALQDLKTQFNADLAKASADRQQALSDARQREADLQAQLSQQTQALQNTQAQTQQQLSALSSEKQQEDLVSQQLVGLYSVVQSDIAARNYPKALTSLQAISSYVSSSEVAVLPGIARRRPVDLFIVESLSSLVQGEMDKGKTDTASLVQTTGLINDVRGYVSSADALLKDGKVAEAEAQYTLALGVVPEISRSYTYFTTKSREAETARQDLLRAGLARAETAFASGRYPEMLAAYRDALSYLPETAARISVTVSNISSAGSSQAAQRYQADQAQAASDAQRTQADQDLAASAALAQADGLLAQRRYADAVTQYLAVLQSHPRSSRAVSAVKGINDGVAAISAQSASDLRSQSDQAAALKTQLVSLQNELSGRTAEITGIKKSLMGLAGMTGDPAATPTDSVMDAVNRKFGDLAGAQDASSGLAAQLRQVQTNALTLQKRIDDLTAENQKLKTGGQPAAQTAAASGPALSPEDARRLKNLDALTAGYRSYADQEDAIIASQGEQRGRMRTIGLRDQFLGSLDGAYRGLLDRIHRYDDRFIQDSLAQGIDEGRQAGLQRAMSVVLELSRKTSADQRMAYLDAQVRTADNDPAMKAFLKNLQAVAALMK